MKVDNLHVDESQETTTRMIHILWDVHTARPAFGNTEATLANIAEKIHKLALEKVPGGTIRRFMAFASTKNDLSRKHKEERLLLRLEKEGSLDPFRLVPVGYHNSKTMMVKTILTEMFMIVADMKRLRCDTTLLLISSNTEFSFAANRLGDLGCRVVVVAPLELMPPYLTLSYAVTCVDWNAIGLFMPFQHKKIASNISGLGKKEKVLQMERIMRQNLANQLVKLLVEMLDAHEQQELPLEDFVNALAKLGSFEANVLEYTANLFHRVAPVLFSDIKKISSGRRKKYRLQLTIRRVRQSRMIEISSQFSAYNSAVIMELLQPYIKKNERKEEMKRKVMEKEVMEKEAMEKEAMEKEAMEKEAMEKEEMENEVKPIEEDKIAEWIAELESENDMRAWSSASASTSFDNIENECKNDSGNGDGSNDNSDSIQVTHINNSEMVLFMDQIPKRLVRKLILSVIYELLGDPVEGTEDMESRMLCSNYTLAKAKWFDELVIRRSSA